jgi:integrase
MLKQLKIQDLNEKNIIDKNYNSITLKELFELFIEHNKLYKEPKTISTYEDAKNNFKELWEIKIIDIKKIHIQSAIDKLTQKGLKRSTIELNFKKVKLVLNYYTDNYDNSYLPPIKNITLPKQITEEKNALTKTELYELLNKIKVSEKDKYYIATLLAGYCGLRIGEILGLTWNDLKENEMLLDINKQWKLDKNGDENFGELKSPNAYRKVPITQKVLTELKEYKNTSITDINKRIIVVKPESFISQIDRITNKYSNVSIHELRHTYATLLISNDVDFKTAVKLLGHDVKETINTYSHVTDDMLNNAVNKIKNIF